MIALRKKKARLKGSLKVFRLRSGIPVAIETRPSPQGIEGPLGRLAGREAQTRQVKLAVLGVA